MCVCVCARARTAAMGVRWEIGTTAPPPPVLSTSAKNPHVSCQPNIWLLFARGRPQALFQVGLTLKVGGGKSDTGSHAAPPTHFPCFLSAKCWAGPVLSTGGWGCENENKKTVIEHVECKVTGRALVDT